MKSFTILHNRKKLSLKVEVTNSVIVIESCICTKQISLIIKTGRASEKARDALIGLTSNLRPFDPAVQQVVDALLANEIVQENPQKRRRNKKAASQPTDIEAHPLITQTQHTYNLRKRQRLQ